MTTMTVQSAKDLLARIKKEIYRRSGMDENGNPLLDENMRHFNQPILSSPDDSLFEIGYTDDVIRALNGAPIINTLLNITDYKDLRLVHEYDPIPGAFDIDLINLLLDKMEAEDFDSATSTCRSACTGLCVNNCTSSCMGGCENSCSMCTDNCSSGCETSCTGCTESCGTTCGISCGSSCINASASCTECSAGCTGCTGCSETCTGTCNGCNYTCSKSCIGGLTSTATVSTSIPIITLYHNAEIYTKIKVSSASNGTFILPEYGYDVMNPYIMGDIHYKWKSEYDDLCEYTDSPGWIVDRPQYWTDGHGQLFEANDTIYFASTESQLKTNRALGRKTTMSNKLYTVIMSHWSELSRYHVEVPLKTITDVISTTYTITEPTWVFISAFMSGSMVSGFKPGVYGIYINGDYVNLPYKGVLSTNDIISVISNSDVRYTIKRVISDDVISDEVHIIDQIGYAELPCKLDVNGHCTFCDIEVDIENDRFIYTKMSDKECDVPEIEDAKFIGVSLKCETADFVHQYSYAVKVQNNLMLGADKKYHGYVYSLDIDIYNQCNMSDVIGKDTQYYPNIYYGDTDRLMGKVAFASTEEQKYSPLAYASYDEISPEMHSGSKYKYQFTVPETNQLNANAFCNDTTSPYSVKFLPGHTYTLYQNQSIVLHPVLE